MNASGQDLQQIESLRDNLTGLYTRTRFEANLEREVVRAQARGRSLSVVMIELDHFDQFKAECGDPAGGILLQVIAQMIQSQIRPADFACRYWQSEFAIVLPEAPGNVARRRGEQFRAAIRRVGWCHNTSLTAPVTLAAGVASFPDHATDCASLLHAARAALYRATESGGDCVIMARTCPRLAASAIGLKPSSPCLS
ncbi:MAG TPA: GGDEF domain-containing protein [Candidatus Acidoferrales bacterium]|nr:GGDEF domain-containing protein [Candidatus Acidoferrales bacterium]